MKSISKVLALLLALVLIVALFASCKPAEEGTDATTTPEESVEPVEPAEVPEESTTPVEEPEVPEEPVAPAGENLSIDELVAKYEEWTSLTNDAEYLFANVIDPVTFAPTSELDQVALKADLAASGYTEVPVTVEFDAAFAATYDLSALVPQQYGYLTSSYGFYAIAIPKLSADGPSLIEEEGTPAEGEEVPVDAPAEEPAAEVPAASGATELKDIPASASLPAKVSIGGKEFAVEWFADGSLATGATAYVAGVTGKIGAALSDVSGTDGAFGALFFGVGYPAKDVGNGWLVIDYAGLGGAYEGAIFLTEGALDAPVAAPAAPAAPTIDTSTPIGALAKQYETWAYMTVDTDSVYLFANVIDPITFAPTNELDQAALKADLAALGYTETTVTVTFDAMFTAQYDISGLGATEYAVLNSDYGFYAIAVKK
jgi:hypothetical protein